MRFKKDNAILYVTIILFIATLIRFDFVALFGFSLGFLLGNYNKSEKWVSLNEI